MSSAGWTLDVARSQLGVQESPPGSNQVLYSDWYPMPGEPWCGMFVSWVADRSDATACIPKYAYTPDGAQWFKDRGLWVTGGYRPGDVVFYQWPSSDRICHTGLVEAWDGNTLTAIEGNTDESGGGSGGKVMRQYRTSSIKGAGRPAYTDEGEDMAQYYVEVAQNTGQEISPAGEDVRWQEEHEDDPGWHGEAWPSIAPDRRVKGNAAATCYVDGPATVRLRTYSSQDDPMTTVAAQTLHGPGWVSVAGYVALSDGHKLRVFVDPETDAVVCRYGVMSLAARDG